LDKVSIASSAAKKKLNTIGMATAASSGDCCKYSKTA
jgi:hypothetical protein